MELRLPNVSGGPGTGPGGALEPTRLHLFAVTLMSAGGDGGSGAPEKGRLALQVQLARSTTTWLEGTNKTQIVDVTVASVGPEWVLADHGVQVAVEAPGGRLRTVVPGVIRRLRPGDQARVRVGVVNGDGVAEGSRGPATVRISAQGLLAGQLAAAEQLRVRRGVRHRAVPADVRRHLPPRGAAVVRRRQVRHLHPLGRVQRAGLGQPRGQRELRRWYWWNMNRGQRRRATARTSTTWRGTASSTRTTTSSATSRRRPSRPGRVGRPVRRRGRALLRAGGQAP